MPTTARGPPVAAVQAVGERSPTSAPRALLPQAPRHGWIGLLPFEGRMAFDLDRRRFLALLPGAAGAAVWSGCRTSEGDGPDSLAWQVHRATRNTLAGAIGRALWPDPAPPPIAKAYPGLPRIPLPEPPPLERGGEPDLFSVVRSFAPAPTLGASGLPLTRLARLLHLAYGVTGVRGIPLRAAPSAGALYAGEVYVVAARVEGLDPGIYSYHAPTHQLVRLASGSFGGAVAAAVEAPGVLAAAPASVLLTNVFHRYTHRYRNRGYRYALIDSGHIGENLCLAAAAEGLGVVTPLRFHDAALDALLGIDGRQEAVCALHAVGAPGDAGARVASPERELVPAHRLASFEPPEDASVPERYHGATRLVPVPATSHDARETQDAPWPRTSGRTRPLQEPSGAAASEAGVAWSIRERRSAMSFLDAPIARAQLATLLELGRGSEAGRLAPWLELRVVAHRVDGLAAGLYRDAPPDRRLERLRAGDLRSALERACLGQEKASSAAIALAMVADVEAASAHGARAYRAVLLEAGAIGQRLYLAAEALGLAARNLAAFFDDDLNALLAVDAAREAVVHLTMVGAGD